MGSLMERLYWWWMRRTSKVWQVDGLEFIYVSADRDTRPEVIVEILSTAISQLVRSSDGSDELVKSHLQFVAAVNAHRNWVALSARGLVTAFTEYETSHPRFLASRLVYAATLIKLVRDSGGARAQCSMTEFRQRAKQAQQDFLNQFPNADMWFDRLG